ncbi:iron-containing alcohol dehydrogenase [Streptomyces sp. CAU 1734]|uniref:iron-containing alcohol dehydrogenase n=1 Tax=Streptomyces sp. CAU 1734 TaxID=3140360 RepID=UPI003261C355
MRSPTSPSPLSSVEGPSELRLIALPGATARLPGVVAERRPSSVAVFGTPRAVSESRVPQLLASYALSRFSAITPNPTLETALAGARMLLETRPDVVVAVGGGSTLDVAKAACLLPADRDAALAVLDGDSSRLREERPMLVLIPTTAGSGSEVTRFATVYVDGCKKSLDHPTARADVALVDPHRTYTCPPSVTYPSAFDALAHAIESLWSRHSTTQSVTFATGALGELVDLTGQSLQSPTTWQRERLAFAATSAGRAIDISRTTAGHAFSYWLTSHRDVPHGVACLLSLLWLLPYNARHVPAVHRDRLATVFMLLGADGGSGPAAANAAAAALRERLERAGFPVRLGQYGVGAEDLSAYVAAGLGARSRSDNNPAPLYFDAIQSEVLRHV